MSILTSIINAIFGKAPTVDVEAVLTERAKGREQLNWRSSIVDLMKLLDLDSSLDNRVKLAKELGWDGPPGAIMNQWLHKRVMAKLAESGGKVPSDLQ